LVSDIDPGDLLLAAEVRNPEVFQFVATQFVAAAAVKPVVAAAGLVGFRFDQAFRFRGGFEFKIQYFCLRIKGTVLTTDAIFLNDI